VDTLLAAGHGVVVVDDLSTGKRENLSGSVELVVADICDRAGLAKAMQDVDGCFHLAAVASVAKCQGDWVGSHRTNLTGTITVFDVARGVGISPPTAVVYSSSAAVYGDVKTIPLTEDALVTPVSAYGADKLGGELHARVAWMAYGVPSTGLRFFNVYGPRQDPQSPYSGVISIFLNKIRNGQTLEVYGDGLQTRDFVFVSDVVSHLMAAMARTRCGAHIYNVCTGRQTSVVDLISRLGGTLQRRPDFHITAARPGDIRYSVGSPRQATTNLGVAADIDINTGIRLFVSSGPTAGS